MAKYKIKKGVISVSTQNLILRDKEKQYDEAVFGGKQKAQAMEKQGWIELVGKKEPVKKGK